MSSRRAMPAFGLSFHECAQGVAALGMGRHSLLMSAPGIRGLFILLAHHLVMFAHPLLVPARRLFVMFAHPLVMLAHRLFMPSFRLFIPAPGLRHPLVVPALGVGHPLVVLALGVRRPHFRAARHRADPVVDEPQTAVGGDEVEIGGEETPTFKGRHVLSPLSRVPCWLWLIYSISDRPPSAIAW